MHCIIWLLRGFFSWPYLVFSVVFLQQYAYALFASKSVRVAMSSSPSTDQQGQQNINPAAKTQRGGVGKRLIFFTPARVDLALEGKITCYKMLCCCVQTIKCLVGTKIMREQGMIRQLLTTYGLLINQKVKSWKGKPQSETLARPRLGIFP